MQIVNTIHLFTSLLTYIMINGFGINWTSTSLFYCKFRWFYVQLCVYLSFTCMCLAIIDQFLATCSHPRWNRWNNLKLAHYVVIGAVIIWILHGIPFLMYYNLVISSITNKSSCAITNAIFQNYNNFTSSILGNSLPIIIMLLFGILAYRNVKRIAYRTVPLVRRELDKQLTVMVLVQVFCDIITVIPQIIYSIFSLIIGTPTDLITLTKLNFIYNVVLMLYYFHFVVGINNIKILMKNFEFLYIYRIHFTSMYVYQNDFVNN